MPFGVVKSARDAIKAYEKQQRSYLKAQEDFRKLKARPQLTPEQKFERALARQDKKQLKVLKSITMPNSGRVRKTPEQRFEQALAKQDKKQLKALKMMTSPLTAEEEQKRLIRNQKARERYARKRLMALGQSVPLPASPAPVRPRVRRVIRQYPALPASYR
jgi:hypothetical protein